MAADLPREAAGAVCYVVFRPDSLTYTVVRALSWGHHLVWVCTADPNYSSAAPNRIHRLLAATPGIQVVSHDASDLPSGFDRLIVQVYPRLLECSRAVAPLAKRARAVTLVSAGDRSRPWLQAIRLQGQEALAFRANLSSIDRILYKDGFHGTDLFGLFRPRSVVGFDVHSQFLHDEQAFRLIHAQNWDPEAPRALRANFLGSRDPEARRCVIDAVRPYFVAAARDMFWHEYSDAEPGGLGPAEFIDVLTRSDFTLCPPGYSLITHRPIEALLRGSIPVLNAAELDLYAIGLADGVNCIAVGHGNWTAAMDRLAAMPQTAIVAMRRHVRAMLQERVSYDALSRAMRMRLGMPVAENGVERRATTASLRARGGQDPDPVRTVGARTGTPRCGDPTASADERNAAAARAGSP